MATDHLCFFQGSIVVELYNDHAPRVNQIKSDTALLLLYLTHEIIETAHQLKHFPLLLRRAKILQR